MKNNIYFVPAKSGSSDILYIDSRAFIDGNDSLIRNMISNVYSGSFMIERFNIPSAIAEKVSGHYWSRYPAYDKLIRGTNDKILNSETKISD